LLWGIFFLGKKKLSCSLPIRKIDRKIKEAARNALRLYRSTPTRLI
jgi:hypothetical protein